MCVEAKRSETRKGDKEKTHVGKNVKDANNEMTFSSKKEFVSNSKDCIYPVNNESRVNQRKHDIQEAHNSPSGIILYVHFACYLSEGQV